MSYPNGQYGNNDTYPLLQMGGSAAAPPTGDFFSQVTSLQDRIRGLNEQVARIRDLQTRSLSSTNENETARIDSDIAALNENVRTETHRVKGELQNLSSIASSGAQRNQIQRLTQNLKSLAQEYQNVELKYRQDVQDRLKRQFKIVQPDATPEQLKEIASNPNTQIFQQALLSSNRYGDARGAYQDVQDRHQDLRNIEETLAELGQLFQDLDLLVVQQGEALDTIKKTTSDIELNTSKANKQLDVAKRHAERARRMKIILFWAIVVIVIIIIGAVVGSICGRGSCSSN